MLPDLNCDMGEGMGNDEAIMPYIHAANIACGFHAGSGDTIRRTMDLAIEHHVKIGAHPSFRDREYFGRREMHLSGDKIYALVLEQLIRIDLIAKEKGVSLHHVKPHGALYNMAARDPQLARTIATAVMDFNEDLVMYGLSGSCLVQEAAAMGLKVRHEVFADRTYQDDGSLTPRDLPGALIDELPKMQAQVQQFISDGSVTTLTGKIIPLQVDTICIHGDGPRAVAFAIAIHKELARRSNDVNNNDPVPLSRV